MSLKKKIIDLFDVYIPEKTPSKQIVRELDRRGKLTNFRKVYDALFMIADELDSLNQDED